MRRACLTAVLALGFLAFQALSAYAEFVGIPVGSGNLTGSRSTPDTSGIIAADGWTDGFTVEWVITQSGAIYTYSYTINANFGTPPGPGLSHFILEVSPSITDANLGDVIFNGPAIDLDSWTTGGSNPDMPASIYGIKVDTGSSNSYIFSFDSTRMPIWGDFYAKDGKHDEIWATAWNTGFGTDPDPLLPGFTGFTNWIPIPDTITDGGGGPPIPEPSSLLLLLLGGCGVLASRLRRKA